MRTKFIIVILSILVLLPSPARVHQTEGVNAVVIHITDEGFLPNEINISQGTTVLFENVGTVDHWPASNEHPTHNDYSALDPRRPVNPGDVWEFTFGSPGVYGVHDHLYPHNTGIITVSNGNKDISSRLSFFSSIFKTLNTLLSDITSKFFDYLKTRQHSSLKDTAYQDLDEDSLVKDYFNNCTPTDFRCFSDMLKGITQKHGPKIAIDTFVQLQQLGAVGDSIDAHQLGHIVGRETAQHFGSHLQSFLLSPMMELVGGCQHGFFENVLGQVHDPGNAAQGICSSIEETTPLKRKLCYHGVGHGLLMARAYKAKDALSICDELSESVDQKACHSGVFMEDALRGPGSHIYIDETNVFKPCDSFDNVYRESCYFFHSDRLLLFTQNNIADAATICYSLTEENEREACINGLTVQITVPFRQVALTDIYPKSDPVNNSWELCKLVNVDLIGQCINHVTYLMLLIDAPVISRPDTFCQTVDAMYKNDCYKTLCNTAKNLELGTSEIMRVCKTGVY